MYPAVYHVSDQPGITCFHPPPGPIASGQVGEVVWAVGNTHLHNYLLPRDCPRVASYAKPDSDPSDVARLMPGSTAKHAVATESAWLESICRQRHYNYSLPSESFEQIVAVAGYYVSRESVVPVAVEEVHDLLTALVAWPVELRLMSSLWKFRDLVIESTMQFSRIRFRNAQPPPEDYTPRHP